MQTRVRTSTKFLGLQVKGLTLIELMVVVSISIIIMTFASSSTRELLEKRSIEQTASAIYDSVAFAQSYAIKAADQVVLCASVSGTVCVSGNWTNGWVIASPDRDNSSQLQILKRIDPPKYGARIITPVPNILINQHGFIASTSTQNIVVCNPKFNNFWVNLDLQASRVLRVNNFYIGGITTAC